MVGGTKQETFRSEVEVMETGAAVLSPVVTQAKSLLSRTSVSGGCPDRNGDGTGVSESHSSAPHPGCQPVHTRLCLLGGVRTGQALLQQGGAGLTVPTGRGQERTPAPPLWHTGCA